MPALIVAAGDRRMGSWWSTELLIEQEIIVKGLGNRISGSGTSPGRPSCRPVGSPWS